jgi:hypothetical protein
VLSAAGILALTYGLIEASRLGWTSLPLLALLLSVAAALAGFVVLEFRRRAPMLDLSLFRSSTFSGAVVVSLLTSLSVFGILFFLSLYMQNVLGYRRSARGRRSSPGRSRTCCSPLSRGSSPIASAPAG